MTRVIGAVEGKAVQPREIDQPTMQVWPLKRIRTSDALRAAVPADSKARRALTEKIRQDGRVDAPLDVTPEGVVVDGYGRLDAAREASLTSVPVTIHPEWAGRCEAELIAESISRNVETRRHLTQAQWVQLGRTIERVEVELARERKRQGQIEGGRARSRKSKQDWTTQLTGNVPPKQQARLRALDVVASRVDMDRRTYERGRKVLEIYETGKAPLARLYVEDLVSAGLMLRALATNPTAQRQHAILRAVDQFAELPGGRRGIARAKLKGLLPVKKTKPLEVKVVVKRLSALDVDLAILVDGGLPTVDAATRTKLLHELDAVAQRLEELRSALEAAPE